MPRPTSIWLRSQDNHYYITHRGKKLKLSPDEKEATRLFHELMAKEQEPAGTSISPSLRKVADLFLDDAQKNKKPNTYRMAKYFLQSLCDRVGRKRIADLKVLHITEWVNANDWHDSTPVSARSTVLACLNWAVNEGYIERHPLAKLKRGTHKRRDRYLTAEERKLILANVKQDFADFLLALELTGARPFSEMATLTAAMINWITNTIPFGEHKNQNKGKSRTIYLTPPLIKLLRRKCKEHPTGLLFRNIRGNQWTSHDAGRRLDYVTGKLKLEKATIYAFRHAYCTDALSRGMNANLLGELVGNSPITLTRHYEHLSKKRDTMLQAARQAVGQ